MVEDTKHKTTGKTTRDVTGWVIMMKEEREHALGAQLYWQVLLSRVGHNQEAPAGDGACDVQAETDRVAAGKARGRV